MFPFGVGDENVANSKHGGTVLSITWQKQSKPPLTFQTVNNTVRDYLTNESLKRTKITEKREKKLL